MLTNIIRNSNSRRIANPIRQKMRGAVAVELGFMLILVLVPLLFGIADLGRMLFQYNALSKSVRDGAKLMSLCPPGYPDSATFQKQAKWLVVFGNTTGEDDPLVNGLTTDNVAFAQSTIGTVRMVTVKVTGFSLGYITGLPQLLGIPALQPFTNISTTMRQSETCAAPFA